MLIQILCNQATQLNMVPYTTSGAVLEGAGINTNLVSGVHCPLLTYLKLHPRIVRVFSSAFRGVGALC